MCKDSSTRNFYQEAECFMMLLKELDNQQLVGNLFVELLKSFVDMRKQDTFRELADQVAEGGEEKERSLMLLHLLASMSECLGEKIVQDVVQVATLLRVLFEGGDEVVGSLCLGILSALLSGAVRLNEAESILLLDLLPYLRELKDHPEEHIRVLATELHVRIISRDRSWFDDKPGSHPPHSPQKRDVELILADLRDPLLPVRGQALVALRNLVLARDEFAKSNRDKLLDIFQAQLRGSDSYLYQAAILGLSAMGDIFAEEVIPILVRSFLNELLSEETRLKLGETLVRVGERCGEALPKWGHHFVSALLAGAQATSADLRASSLSNLATVCELMRFSLLPYVHDVSNVLIERMRDSHPEVRMGCLFVLSRLFVGMGVESLELLADHLRQLYRLLRSVSESDPDLAVQLRARETLELLNGIVRAVFEQSAPMAKDHVLNVLTA